MARIGYARVAKAGHDTDEQVKALHAAGCERVFVETATRGSVKRSKLAAAMDYIRDGDALVVPELTMLGRDLTEMRTVVEAIREHGVDLVVLALGIDEDTPPGQLVYAMLDAFAEFRPEVNSAAGGQSEADSPGTGRSANTRSASESRRLVMTPEKIATAQEMYSSRRYSIAAIAKAIGVGRTTLYRYLDVSSRSASEFTESASELAEPGDARQVGDVSDVPDMSESVSHPETDDEPTPADKSEEQKPKEDKSAAGRFDFRKTQSRTAQSEPPREVLSPTSSLIEVRKRYYRP